MQHKGRLWKYYWEKRVRPGEMVFILRKKKILYLKEYGKALPKTPLLQEKKNRARRGKRGSTI